MKKFTTIMISYLLGICIVSLVISRLLLSLAYKNICIDYDTIIKIEHADKAATSGVLEIHT